MKAYYSLIQFRPDASRLEAVNVGVVLFCPDAGFLACRISKSNRRAEKLVGRGGLDRTGLDAAKRAIQRRLQSDRQAFASLEDFQRFVDSRGNALKLTPPRPLKVSEPERDLDNLFDELVGGRARGGPRRPKLPLLDETFTRLRAEGRARLDWSVNVPMVGRTLDVPYAYRNGVWNLVKPHRFSSKDRSATDAAMRLAVEGDLLQRHSDESGPKNLIVITLFRGGPAPATVADRVRGLLGEYKVESICEGDLPAFAARVEQESHAVAGG